MKLIVFILMLSNACWALDAPVVQISVNASRFDSVFVELSWEPVEGVDKYQIYGEDLLLSEQVECVFTEVVPTNWGFNTPTLLRQYHVVSAGRMYWNGHHYQLVLEPRDITAAEMLADQYPDHPRGYICNIESQEEQDFVNGILQGMECLLGARRGPGCPEWCWKRWWPPYSYSMDYLNWEYPPNSSAHSAMINNSSGMWQSVFGYYEFPYLIEWGDGTN